MELTEWYQPPIEPVRVGWYESTFFDAGWTYEERIWWDGFLWRESPKGFILFNQARTWRGATSEQTT